jgi:ankyrin repeat protein
VNARRESGFAALMMATANGVQYDTIKQLIQAGAEVNARDDDGHTALFYAMRDTAKERVVELLKSAGAVM